MISRKRNKGLKPRLPEWAMDKNYKPLQHEVDQFSTWIDRAAPTPSEDKDPRTAFDALDPDRPKGMG